MEKIDETISAIEKGKIESCQEKLAEGKKIILKQQKLLRIVFREEDGWEVMKCSLSILLLIQRMKNSSLELVGKQLQQKKREANKQKDKSKQFWNAPPPPPLPNQKKVPKSLANYTKDTVALEITQNLTKSVLPANKIGIFNFSAQI